jgi:hypothetical protein
MAKFIQVVAAGEPAYIPSSDMLKITATTSAVTFTYVGGSTIAITASGTPLTAADAVASFYASLGECINAGPDAAGSVVNSYYADYDSGIS